VEPPSDIKFPPLLADVIVIVLGGIVVTIGIDLQLLVTG
jgi:hypothetical protein